MSLSTGKQYVNPQTIRWRAASLHFISSASLPDLSFQVSAKKIPRGNSDRVNFFRQRLNPSFKSEDVHFSPESFHPARQGPDIVIQRCSSSSHSDSEDEGLTLEKKNHESISLNISEHKIMDLSIISSHHSFQESDASPQSRGSPRSTPITLHKILLIDDNPYSRRAMISDAEKCGVTECDEAKDETTGLQMYRILALQSSVYLAIIVNLIRPAVNGLSFVRKVRVMENKYNYPRTFICGIAEAQPVEHSLLDHYSKNHTVPNTISTSTLFSMLSIASKK